MALNVLVACHILYTVPKVAWKRGLHIKPEYGVIETLYMDWRYMFEEHLCVGQY